MSHRRRQWHSTPVLLPGKFHGRRSLVGCSPWGRLGSDKTERLHFHFSLYALEKEMATHSSVLAWRIPGTGEPGGLLGSHRVGHDWSDLAADEPFIDIFRIFHPNAEEYTFFSSAHGTFSRIEHIHLGPHTHTHTKKLNKFKKIEIKSSIFSNHNTMRLDINHKKKKNKQTKKHKKHGD